MTNIYAVKRLPAAGLKASGSCIFFRRLASYYRGKGEDSDPDAARHF
jgi:hypothetical protein